MYQMVSREEGVVSLRNKPPGERGVVMLQSFDMTPKL